MNRTRQDSAKCIWLEWRRPETKREQKVYGQTRFTSPYAARVFINAEKTFPEQIRTFWHEMAHVFVGFHQAKKRMTRAQEEDLCYRLEGIIWEVLR